ncbi:HTH_Tnp_Tc3_2 domain-containing protein [Trichonephila clavipes]|nr:HTH_Tnp_Tc3_2 domain-containing protein [Trichonephila clavipes]
MSNLGRQIVGRLEEAYGKFQDTSFIEKKPGQGRPRLSVIARRIYSKYSFSALLYAARVIWISRVTVLGSLHESVLFARRPVDRIPFSSANRRAHLKWCGNYRDGSMNQWITVFYS